MTPQEIKDKIIEIVKERSIEDLTVVDVANQTVVTDYMVIMTCRTNSAVRNLCDYIEEKAERVGLFVTRKEGVREGRWVVMDYAGVIVHIFNKEMRGYYSLEKLWENGENITHIEV